MKHILGNYFKVLLLVLLPLLMISCGNEQGESLDREEVVSSDSTVIQLEMIKILFPAVEQWDEKGATIYKEDSVVIYDKNGEMLLEKNFTVNIDVTKDMVVEEQYENLLTIISSDENVSLDHLEKYQSDWKVIVPSLYNRYNKPAMTFEEMNNYPAMSIQDILDYIFLQTRTTQSEFDWNKYLKQAKTIYEFPFQIRVSKITLRLRGEYLNGDQFEKYVVFKLR